MIWTGLGLVVLGVGVGFRCPLSTWCVPSIITMVGALRLGVAVGSAGAVGKHPVKAKAMTSIHAVSQRGVGEGECRVGIWVIIVKVKDANNFWIIFLL